jgi:hypothetical protein
VVWIIKNWWLTRAVEGSAHGRVLKEEVQVEKLKGEETK